MLTNSQRFLDSSIDIPLAESAEQGGKNRRDSQFEVWSLFPSAINPLALFSFLCFYPTILLIVCTYAASEVLTMML